MGATIRLSFLKAVAADDARGIPLSMILVFVNFWTHYGGFCLQASVSGDSTEVPCTTENPRGYYASMFSGVASNICLLLCGILAAAVLIQFVWQKPSSMCFYLHEQ